MNSILNFCDRVFIRIARVVGVPFARLSLFVVFFWFGILKVLGYSPASPLVSDLFGNTIGQVMPFMSADLFILLFGIFEMVIGISFVFPKLVRISIAMLAFHMITTFIPLILLPEVTWQTTFVPTMEGQYIIKNLVIIATAMGIVSHMHINHRENKVSV